MDDGREETSKMKIFWKWRPRHDRNYFKFSRCSRVDGTSFKYTWRYWFWLATFRFEIRKVWNGQWLAPPEVHRSSQTWTGSVAKLLCILALGGLESRSDWSAVEWNKKVWGDHTDAAACRPLFKSTLAKMMDARQTVKVEIKSMLPRINSRDEIGGRSERSHLPTYSAAGNVRSSSSM